jgi:hypothetical protein
MIIDKAGNLSRMGQIQGFFEDFGIPVVSVINLQPDLAI